MAYVVNVAIHDSFPFRDNTAALVSGKVNGDWTKVLVHDGVVDSSTTVTVSAVSGASGYYDSSFTPASVGLWQLFLTVTHNGVVYPFASDIYDVIPAAADPAAIADAIAGIMDQSSTGYDAGTIGYEIHALFKRPVGSG